MYVSGLNGSKLGGGSGLKRLSESLSRKTPSKTPRRSPSRLATRSPGRAGSKSPGRNNGISPGRGADRFIPDRQTTDTELSHYKLTREEAEDREMMSPSKRDYQRAVQENLGIDLANTRVLSYQTKPPSAPDGHRYLIVNQSENSILKNLTNQRLALISATI